MLKALSAVFPDLVSDLEIRYGARASVTEARMRVGVGGRGRAEGAGRCIRVQAGNGWAGGGDRGWTQAGTGGVGCGGAGGVCVCGGGQWRAAGR
eukprot:6083798-Prymnesium_polylepis.1